MPLAYYSLRACTAGELWWTDEGCRLRRSVTHRQGHEFDSQIYTTVYSAVLTRDAGGEIHL
jgi:hypothetical protein